MAITKKLYNEVVALRRSIGQSSKKLEDIREKLFINLEFEKAGEEPPYDYALLHSEAEEIRNIRKTSSQTLSDGAALFARDVFPKWDEFCTYSPGERFVYNNKLYRCKQTNPINPTWTPDVAYDFYEPVANPGEDGSIAKPITAVSGMEYEYGKHYIENGVIYLCKRDGENYGEKITLHYLPSMLIGQYFEKI